MGGAPVHMTAAKINWSGLPPGNFRCDKHTPKDLDRCQTLDRGCALKKAAMSKFGVNKAESMPEHVSEGELISKLLLLRWILCRELTYLHRVQALRSLVFVRYDKAAVISDEAPKVTRFRLVAFYRVNEH